MAVVLPCNDFDLPLLRKGAIKILPFADHWFAKGNIELQNEVFLEIWTAIIKKGDKNTYTFSKFLLNGNSEYQENVTWNDQSSSNITIKKGISITLEICNVTSDPTNLGAQTVFAKSSWNGKTTPCHAISNVYIFLYLPYGNIFNLRYYESTFVSPVQNVSYYQQYVNQDTSNSTRLNGDIYSISYRNPRDSPNIKNLVNVSTNIKTGWLTDFKFETIVNGTTISDIEFSLGSKSSPGFEFNSVLMVLSISAPIALVLRKKGKLKI